MNFQKHAKIAALTAAQKVRLSSLMRKSPENDICILCYHGAWMSPLEFPGDAMFIRPEVFKRRLDLIEAGGYQVVALDDAVAALLGEREPIKKSVVITIDDGWKSTYEIMAPELKRRNMPATLYCDTRNFLSGQQIAHLIAMYARQIAGAQVELSAAAEEAYAQATDLNAPLEERLEPAKRFSSEIGVEFDRLLENDTFLYMSADQLRELAEFGVDVQLHTHTHSLGDFSGARVEAELAANRRELSALLGRPEESFTHFCYPSGEYAIEALPHFKRSGVRSATTCEARVATRQDDILLLPRILDHGAATEAEFKAELDGTASLLRRLADRPESRRPEIQQDSAAPASQANDNKPPIASEERKLAAALGAKPAKTDVSG